MIQTIITCDCCGRTINREDVNRDQLWYVKVSYKEGSEPIPTPYKTYDAITVIWCRECLEKTGLVPKIKTPPSYLPISNMTIEDIVREIVNETLNERGVE